MSQPEYERLDSWKEIAAYLGRDLRTLRRWEEEKGLPIHRVPGGERRAVFAYRTEIDAWLLRTDHEPDRNGQPSALPDSRVNQKAPSVTETEPRVSLAVQNVEARQVPPPVRFTSLRKPAIALGLTLIACTALMLLGLIFFFTRKTTQAADPLGSGIPVVPQGIEHWLRISLVNGQAQALTGPFPQQVIVDSLKNTKFEADGLQNVEFFDERGNILKSWLESGNSKFSSSTVYWIQLPVGIPARKVVDIYQGFAAPSQSLFNRSDNGEAPGLSPNYGEYDNGSAVFLKYANFAGDSLPSGWYVGTTPGGQGQVQVKNGVFLSHSGRGGGATFLGSDWIVGDNIAEMSLLSQQTVNGQEMIFVCSASPTRFRWTPVSVGYQNMSGLEIEDNTAGTPSVLAIAKPNPSQSAVIGFQGGPLYADYQPVARISQRICGGGYLASSANTGYSASFSFDWIRLRTPPPNGVMPTVIVGESR
jgi:hypothetical protein